MDLVEKDAKSDEPSGSERKILPVESGSKPSGGPDMSQLERVPEQIIETVRYLYAYKCAICGKAKPLTIHHLKPRWKSGENHSPWNLAPLCFACHEEIQPTRDTPNDRRHRWTNLLWKGQAHRNPFHQILSLGKVSLIADTQFVGIRLNR